MKALLLLFMPVLAFSEEMTVPLNDAHGFSTFYVTVGVRGAEGPDYYLVDTGAGYMTITDELAAKLRANGSATRQGELKALLADGTEHVVPVYRLDEIRLGDCAVRNVKAAVIPNANRGLIGWTVLRQIEPFTMSSNPPSIRLTCRH